ncbi:MAG TPA: hypothetical protein VIH61_03260 [Waddliaceae bacterium]
MDNMNFEEEIQDKQYFEDKIQKLEERIRALENFRNDYEKWVNQSIFDFNDVINDIMKREDRELTITALTNGQVSIV